MILCIDPGAHDIGWAMLRPYPVEITECGFFAFTSHRQLCLWLAATTFSSTLIERPRADLRSKHSIKIINDLLDVTLTAGVCAGSCPDVQMITPHEWKGSMPKDKHQKARILPALAKRPEGARILRTLSAMTKDKRIDATDAVGLALWWIDNGLSKGGL